MPSSIAPATATKRKFNQPASFRFAAKNGTITAEAINIAMESSRFP